MTLATGRPLRGVVIGVRRPDGVRRLSVTTALVDLAEHDRAAVVITFSDITDRRREAQQRRRAEEQFRHAFEAAPVGMAVIGLDGRLLRVNGALGRIAGLSRDELTGSHVSRLLLPRDMPRLSNRARQLLVGEVTEVLEELSVIAHRGPPTWVLMSATLVRDADGTPLHFLVQTQDIEARKRAEDRLRHLADHDSLTGLLNRRAFEQHLEQHVHARRRGDGGALLLLDIDRFKDINDTLGHAAGDRVITAVGRAIAERLRGTDVLARLGGDEFAVLLPHGCAEDVRTVAAALRERIRGVTYVDADGHSRAVSVSIGVALLADPARRPPGSALVQADSAMYAAKAGGRDGWRVAAGDAAPAPAPVAEAPDPQEDRLH